MKIKSNNNLNNILNYLMKKNISKRMKLKIKKLVFKNKVNY